MNLVFSFSVFVAICRNKDFSILILWQTLYVYFKKNINSQFQMKLIEIFKKIYRKRYHFFWHLVSFHVILAELSSPMFCCSFFKHLIFYVSQHCALNFLLVIVPYLILPSNFFNFIFCSQWCIRLSLAQRWTDFIFYAFNLLNYAF